MSRGLAAFVLRDKVTQANVAHKKCCQSKRTSQKKNSFPVYMLIAKQSLQVLQVLVWMKGQTAQKTLYF